MKRKDAKLSTDWHGKCQSTATSTRQPALIVSTS